MKVVIAYDGSSNAKDAIRYMRPYLNDAEVLIWVGFVPQDPFFDRSEDEAEKHLVDGHAQAAKLCDEAEAWLEGSARKVTSVVGWVTKHTMVEACPSELRTIGHCLVRAAVEAEADLLVMGSRGQGSLKSMVLGSVGQVVLEKCKEIPVLIVHEGATDTRGGYGPSVLFTVDGSERSLSAMESAVRLGFVPESANVHFLYARDLPRRFELLAPQSFKAVPNPKYPQQCSDMDEMSAAIEARARDRLHAACSARYSTEIPYARNATFFVYGSDNVNKGAEFCQKEHHIDLVVVGSRGAGGSGSLADYLLHESEAFALLVTRESHHSNMEDIEIVPSPTSP